MNIIAIRRLARTAYGAAKPYLSRPVTIPVWLVALVPIVAFFAGCGVRGCQDRSSPSVGGMKVVDRPLPIRVVEEEDPVPPDEWIVYGLPEPDAIDSTCIAVPKSDVLSWGGLPLNDFGLPAGVVKDRRSILLRYVVEGGRFQSVRYDVEGRRRVELYAGLGGDIFRRLGPSAQTDINVGRFRLSALAFADVRGLAAGGPFRPREDAVVLATINYRIR